jgi:hypothetical protein
MRTEKYHGNIDKAAHSQKGIGATGKGSAFREKHGENAENADFHKKMRAYEETLRNEEIQDTDEVDPG